MWLFAYSLWYMYRNDSNTLWYKSSLGFLVRAEVVSFPRVGYSTLQDKTIRLSGNAEYRSLRDPVPYTRSRPWTKFTYKQHIRMPNVAK